MPRRTDDIIHEFINQNYTVEEATELANEYIAVGIEVNIQTYIERLHRGGIRRVTTEEIEAIDLDEIEEAPPNLFDIGADYEGIKEIVEDDRENIYIPSSYYCILKCFEKSFERNIQIINQRKKTNNEWKGISTERISPYFIKLQSAKLLYKKTLIKYLYGSECKCRSKCETCENENVNELIPEIYKVTNKKITILSKKKNISIVNDSIILGHLGRGKYHAMLAKRRTPGKYKDYNFKLKITQNLNLEVENVKVKPETFKDPDRYVVVYDIETYEVINENSKNLTPYALAYSLVDLENKTYEEPVIIDKNEFRYIFNEMFERLDYKCKEKNIQKIQVFAHNGARFDNLYMKSATNMKIIQSIIDGTTNKSIECRTTDICYIFKDTYPFVLSSLKNALKTFKCVTQKLDFEIAGFTLQQYQNTTEWRKYLEYDVKGLAELVIKYEEGLKDYGESITTCLGSSSLAWKILRKTCIWSDSLYIPKTPSLIKFMRESCYGGRVLHWKKHFQADKTDKMISLDYNSLYPSAMMRFPYPVGECSLIENPETFDIFNTQARHYIIEAEIDAGNIRYPIHPYRDEKNNLIYKSNLFSGVYNDVDIKEMVRDGYQIKKIKRGVYWNQSVKIFSHLIEKLYEKRKIYKANNDSREYMIKIILNSMYGKFLEVITTSSVYNEPNLGVKIISAKMLKNKQIEYITELDNPIVRKPTYIAGYILAYARKLMNEYIDTIGRENIWYQDTDSIYTKLSCVKNIKLGTGLCQMKNDYGDNKYIDKAYFIDLKRYLLIFNDGSAKAKFLGLNFRTEEWAGEQIDFTDETKIKKVEQLFKDLLKGKTVSVEQDKWKRTGLNVCIDSKNIAYSIDPKKRGDWDNDEFYPKGYCKNLPEKIIIKTSVVDPHVKEIFYRIINGVIVSKCPLVYSINCIESGSKMTTNFYVKNKKLYKYYLGYMCEISLYGVINKIPIEVKENDIKTLGYVNVTFISDTNSLAYFPKMTDLEMKELISFRDTLMQKKSDLTSLSD